MNLMLKYTLSGGNCMTSDSGFHGRPEIHGKPWTGQEAFSDPVYD